MIRLKEHKQQEYGYKYLKEITDLASNAFGSEVQKYQVGDYVIGISARGYYVTGLRTIDYMALPIMPVGMLVCEKDIQKHDVKANGCLDVFELDEGILYYLVNIGTEGTDGGSYLFDDYQEAIRFLEAYIHLKELALTAKILGDD